MRRSGGSCWTPRIPGGRRGGDAAALSQAAGGAANDAKALAYTTAPLDRPLQVLGHPVVHLWIESGAPDLDLFVYLEEVDGSGRSRYVTQGNLRASHRALAPAPFPNFGLPWHDHYRTSLAPMPPGEPVELVFDLLPTANGFSSGRRMRVAVACADAGNFDTPVLSPPPALRILRDPRHPSRIELPPEGEAP